MLFTPKMVNYNVVEMLKRIQGTSKELGIIEHDHDCEKGNKTKTYTVWESY